MRIQAQRIKTTDDLLKVLMASCQLGADLIMKKNRDYGDHQNNDPFANFRRHGATGILVRMDDKLARLTTFAKTGRLNVLEESVVDSAIDLINYAAIFIAYLSDEKARNEEANSGKLSKRTEEDQQGSLTNSQHGARVGRERNATDPTPDTGNSGSGVGVRPDRRSGQDRRGGGGTNKGTAGVGPEYRREAGRILSESHSPVAFR